MICAQGKDRYFIAFCQSGLIQINRLILSLCSHRLTQALGIDNQSVMRDSCHCLVVRCEEAEAHPPAHPVRLERRPIAARAEEGAAAPVQREPGVHARKHERRRKSQVPRDQLPKHSNQCRFHLLKYHVKRNKYSLGIWHYYALFHVNII